MSPYIGIGIREIKIKNSPENIIKTVANHFDVPVKYLKCKSRKHEYLNPRFIAMYFLRKKTELSLSEISAMFGNRHHTTVMHALKTVDDLLFSDKGFKEKVSELNFILK